MSKVLLAPMTTSRRTLFALSTVSVVILLGMGGTAWIWIHRKANLHLTGELEQMRAQLPPGTQMEWGRITALPVSHGARLTDVTLRQNGITLTAASLEVLGMRPAPKGDAAIGAPYRFDHLLAHGVHVETPDGDLDATRLTLDGLTLPKDEPHLSELVIDHGELADFAVHMPTRQLTMTVGNLTLEQYGAGRPSMLTVRGFDLSSAAPPARELSVERFSTDGMDLASGVLTEMTGKEMPQHDGTQNLHVDGLSLKGVIAPKGNAMEPILGIGRVTGFGTMTDQKGHVVISASHLRVWPVEPQTIILKTLGYQKFEGSVILDGVLDYSARALHLSQLNVSASTFGRLDLVGDLLPAPGTEEQPLLEAMRQPLITHLGMTWRDDGLVRRILSNAAVHQGVDPDAYVPLLQKTLTPPGSDPAGVGPQLATYIGHPEAGPVTLSLTPSQPLPLSAIPALIEGMTRPEVASAAGLSVKAPAIIPEGQEPQEPAPDPNLTTDEPVDPRVLAPSASEPSLPPGVHPPVTSPALQPPVTEKK